MTGFNKDEPNSARKNQVTNLDDFLRQIADGVFLEYSVFG